MGLSDTGRKVSIIVSGLDDDMLHDMKMVLRKVEQSYIAHGRFESTRPCHRGVIVGFGHNPLTKVFYGPQAAFLDLEDLMKEFMDNVWATPAVQAATSNATTSRTTSAMSSNTHHHYYQHHYQTH